jgi:hypothetical protein
MAALMTGVRHWRYFDLSMNRSVDVWFVRLPDGRVLRAASTYVVRHHLTAGRIPPESRVRRIGEEEWTALDWTEEFSDLVRTRVGGVVTAPMVAESPPQPQLPGSLINPRIALRYDSRRLQTAGLQALAEELLAALDNTLARPKLMIAGVTGVILGILGFVALNSFTNLQETWQIGLGLALLALLIITVSQVLLTQMTYIELSRLRPAAWKETLSGLPVFCCRLLICFLVAGGCLFGLIAGLRWLPNGIIGYMEAGEFGGAALVSQTLSVVDVLTEVVLWPIALCTLLLAPVIVVEETSIPQALGQWWWLVRRHLGRLFLYQASALVAGLAMLAFAFPVALALWLRPHDTALMQPGMGYSLGVLAGLAAAPLIAYLAVAHVFIYLNLRYGGSERQ